MADEETAQAPVEPTAPAEPTTPPQEAATAAVEPEATQSEPETQTAQIPASEPLPPEAEPFDPAQGKPTPAPEPPQAATSASATPAPASAPEARSGRDLLVKARATIQDRKHKKLDKILEFLNTKGKITNDEVEKLLHVSDATATRYLSALEKEGKIQQVGKTGTGVVYTKV